MTFRKLDPWFELTFWVNPVTASRARVTRGGWTYYGKKYAHFKTSAALGIQALNIAEPLLPGEFGYEVESVHFIFNRPKKPTYTFPVADGDLDNLFKAVTDTMNGTVWVDDKWVSAVGKQVKRYAKHAEEARIVIRFRPTDCEPE